MTEDVVALGDFISFQAFTGDTLFVGSVGRPDLVGSLGHTAEDMAKLMFNTLQTKILTLPDDVQVTIEPLYSEYRCLNYHRTSGFYPTLLTDARLGQILKFVSEQNLAKPPNM